MMLQPGTLASRMTAVLLLGLVLLVAFQMIVQPVLDLYRDNDAAIAQKTDRLQRYRLLAGERETLRGRLAHLQTSESAMVGYIEEASDSLAAAAIQDKARAAITAVGGHIKSVELVPGSAVDGQPTVRQVGLRVRFTASVQGVATVVRELEDAEPYIFLETLSANASGSGMSTDRQENGRLLDISLDLFGYAQAPNPTSSASPDIDHGT